MDYLLPSGRAWNTEAWVNPYDGQFKNAKSPSSGNDEPAYNGGPKAGFYGAFFNNRTSMYVHFLVLAGLHRNDVWKEVEAYYKGSLIGMVGKIVDQLFAVLELGLRNPEVEAMCRCSVGGLAGSRPQRRSLFGCNFSAGQKLVELLLEPLDPLPGQPSMISRLKRKVRSQSFDVCS